jgi:hypothetical protein
MSRTVRADLPADLIIKIRPNDHGNPAGKLADVELHFAGRSPLVGLKLIGFSIWERRAGRDRNVLFPARLYAVKGERRSFALLRPIDDSAAQDTIRDRILEAYAEYEQRAAADDDQRATR